MTYGPIAGWYPDPRNTEAQWRWWNGLDWTHETAPRTAAEVVSPVRRSQDWGWGGTPADRSEPSAPTASPNTPWIWLLAFSFYIFGAVAGVLQGVGLVALPADQATKALVAAVALLAGLVPLWVFAELDGRALRSRGFEAPSVLWMLLLPPLVYFAVRARKLKRVGARSKGPEIAVLIVVAMQIVAGIIGGLFAYSLIQSFMSGSPALG